MLVKEYFYNIKCDCCGRLANEELWHCEPVRGDIDPHGNYRTLGGKDYCEDCWSYDDDDNLVTKDGRKFNEETLEEIKIN